MMNPPAPAGRGPQRHHALLGWLRHPVRGVEDEAHHLREIEREGESGETPFIAILGVLLFLLPIAAVMMGLAFLAYYVIG